MAAHSLNNSTLRSIGLIGAAACGGVVRGAAAGGGSGFTPACAANAGDAADTAAAAVDGAAANAPAASAWQHLFKLELLRCHPCVELLQKLVLARAVVLHRCKHGARLEKRHAQDLQRPGPRRAAPGGRSRWSRRLEFDLRRAAPAGPDRGRRCQINKRRNRNSEPARCAVERQAASCTCNCHSKGGTSAHRSTLHTARDLSSPRLLLATSLTDGGTRLPPHAVGTL
eukprot:366239-Chlamydomonas_euryale.AAC.21